MKTSEPPKYSIGSRVWWATWETGSCSIVCPDCGGTGRLRVTFHDETQVSIDCRNCSTGYDAPTGAVSCYRRIGRAALVTIVGMEITPSNVTYQTDTSYRVEEGSLFDSEEAALAHAQSLSAAADEEERQRILKKEKDTRTWAWNASYHRRQIKEAQRQIEYHTAKLNAAALHVKAERREARTDQST